MAINPQQELIWQGRIHLGDEPGIYGDAHYPGISAEFPITIYRLDPNDTNNKPFNLVLETEDLNTYNGYPGHLITVITYEPDPNQQFHSIEQVIAQERFTSGDNNRKEIEVKPGTAKGPFSISVRLRVDTTVNPGLYDDFIWSRLSLISPNYTYYASFGFKSP